MSERDRLFAELPPPARPGDRVGVAALSGPVDPERLEAGVENLRRLGFEPVLATNLHLRTPLFAGTDAERLEGFHRLAADPTLAAILFARGGHGILRLLDRIDWDLVARRPRAYVGYSDLTPFLNQIATRLGFAAFHGPMVAVEMAAGMSAEEEISFLSALAGELPATLEVEPLVRGSEAVVEGVLLGGCLSLLTATLETDFSPSLDDSILFWEDVDEPLYRLDRMLTHLRLSGNLTALRGMVVGRIELSADEHDWAAPPTEPGGAVELRGELLGELVDEFDGPVAGGLTSGHCRPNLTLPLGLRARLDPIRGRLEVGLLTENPSGDD